MRTYRVHICNLKSLLKAAFIIIFSGSAASSYAASPTLPPLPTIEQKIPNRILNAPEKKIITVLVENDSLGGGTDKNYTSGVGIYFTNVNATFPEIAHDIDRLIPTFKINKTSSIYYSLGHNLYTPRNISLSDVDRTDRPWAAFLYGSIGMATLTDNHTDAVEATLGVIGPAALGEPIQKFIHQNITDSPEPKGWSHQLKNEPGVMLSWQRGWPMSLNGHVYNKSWSLRPYVGATVGNIRTYGDIGVTATLSPSDFQWQDSPLRVKPAMPGTGVYEIQRDKWGWSLFSGIEARAVAHDIFLDGNSFAKSYSVEKKPFVYDANAGVAFTYNNTRVSYTLVYRTKEFTTQDEPEIFGALSVGVRY